MSLPATHCTYRCVAGRPLRPARGGAQWRAAWRIERGRAGGAPRAPRWPRRARGGAFAAKPTAEDDEEDESEPEAPVNGWSPHIPKRSILAHPSALRRLSATKCADEALEAFLDEAVRLERTDIAGPTEEECAALMVAASERGNTTLAVALLESMSASPVVSGFNGAWRWPSAGVPTVAALVLALTRSLQLKQAVEVVKSLRLRSAPGTNAVPFGKVVRSPLSPTKPLAVVQDTEGFSLHADSYSRYEYELFTGDVVSVSSEALVSQQSVLLTAARSLGLWSKAPVGAVHEVVVRTPDGAARTFRFGTATADVPCQEGDRVTFTCAAGSSGKNGRFLLSTRPPGWKPGEPMECTNHATNAVTVLSRPPDSQNTGLPGWVMPAAVVLAGSDAATYFLDPALPAITAGAIGALGASAALTNAYIVPEWKRLPEASLAGESVRQTLLEQHDQLSSKVESLTKTAIGDVRQLGRLWQLERKMQAVGESKTYETRLQRVKAAREGLEGRVARGVELIAGFARVMSMIEIEVEMESQVTTAELDDLAQQVERLEEVERLSQEYRVQAEAIDEVERLLRQDSTVV
ncbi:unnamed protein product [Pedinophyceae sp. YPF-701]|nr:unnamed protein product [Pedinophyceae sp. YPF-701]